MATITACVNLLTIFREAECVMREMEISSDERDGDECVIRGMETSV